MMFDGKELYKDCKAGLHRPAGQDHQAREHISGILVKVQVLWEGQYYSRPFPKTVFEEVRKLVKDYRWSKWASSLCEPSWGKPQG